MLISIHALREEGDQPLHGTAPERPEISIHALREEGDLYIGDYWTINGRFLSTPSARRATDTERLSTGKTGISIHALREEGDAMSSGFCWKRL